MTRCIRIAKVMVGDEMQPAFQKSLEGAKVGVHGPINAESPAPAQLPTLQSLSGLFRAVVLGSSSPKLGVAFCLVFVVESVG